MDRAFERPDGGSDSFGGDKPRGGGLPIGVGGGPPHGMGGKRGDFKRMMPQEREIWFTIIPAKEP